MLGYMTAREAIENGFTNHGSYYGIPCWIGGINSYDDGLRVAAKWAPMEYLMTLFHVIEANLRPLKFPNEPPVFQFLVGKRIRLYA